MACASLHNKIRIVVNKAPVVSVHPVLPGKVAQARCSGGFVVMKMCRRCGQTKELREFYRSKKNRDGRRGTCRECQTKAAQHWNRMHAARHAATNRAYRLRHLDKVSECQRLYRLANPDKRAEGDALDRLRQRGIECEAFGYAKVLERDGMTCHICGGPVERSTLSFDHVIPLSKGGSHSPENVRVAHLSCNQKKNTKVLASLMPMEGS